MMSRAALVSPVSTDSILDDIASGKSFITNLKSCSQWYIRNVELLLIENMCSGTR